MLKEILSLIAIIITFASFWPYVVSIRNNKTKPHVFSWVIWGLTTTIVFFAQLSDSGGAGAWPIGVSGLISLYIAVLAYNKKSDTHITRSDWIYFILALLSLPFWYLTQDPLWAVVTLTTADILGFGPTLRKAYHKPFDEQLLFYLLFAIRNAIAIGALENFSLTTLLFPVATGVGCVILVSILAVRRKTLTNQT